MLQNDIWVHISSSNTELAKAPLRKAQNIFVSFILKFEIKTIAYFKLNKLTYLSRLKKVYLVYVQCLETIKSMKISRI